MIYPVDFRTEGHIVDDEMHLIMVKSLQPGVRLTAIFDSCHSGSALDLPYIYSTQGVLKRGPGRTAVYIALAVLAAIPLLIFGVAQVDATDFDLKGPAGPALAFSAGLLSFVSPCVLPIVPIYITHISGSLIHDGALSPSCSDALPQRESA